MSLHSASRTAIAAAILVLCSASGVAAQEPQAPALEEGDVAWTFAQEDPFFDERIAGALGTLIAPLLEAQSVAPQIVRVQSNGPDFQAAHIYPANDVPLLLEAAGFGNQPPFVEVGQCRYWAASAEVTDAAVLVADALQDALESLGVQSQPCIETTSPDDAHVLVWTWGAAPPVLTQRNTGTFLTSGASPAPTVPPTGQGGGAALPGPPVTGSGGLLDRRNESGPIVLVTALAATTLSMTALWWRRRSGRP